MRPGTPAASSDFETVWRGVVVSAAKPVEASAESETTRGEPLLGRGMLILFIALISCFTVGQDGSVATDQAPLTTTVRRYGREICRCDVGGGCAGFR